MSEENTQPTNSELVRKFSENNNVFLTAIANHVEKLEYELATLRERVAQLEAGVNDVK